MTDKNAAPTKSPDEQISFEKTGQFGKNIVRYNILLGNMVIGKLDLGFSPERGEVIINAIEIDELQRNKGLGKKIYRRILNIEPPIEGTYQLVSAQLNSNSLRVWESLGRSGEAEQLSDGNFRLV